MRTAFLVVCAASCAAPSRPQPERAPPAPPQVAAVESVAAPEPAPAAIAEVPTPSPASEVSAPAATPAAPEPPVTPPVPPVPAAEPPRPKRTRAEPETKDSAADPVAGRAHFVRYCAKCHGEDGRGQTTMGKKLGIADITDPDWQAERNDRDMRVFIRRGVPARKQPAFGPDKLDDAALRDVIAYVRTLAR